MCSEILSALFTSFIHHYPLSKYRIVFAQKINVNIKTSQNEFLEELHHNDIISVY